MISFRKIMAITTIGFMCQMSGVQAQNLPTEAGMGMAPPQKLRAEITPETPGEAPASEETAPQTSANDWLKGMKFEGNKAHLNMQPVHRTEEFIEAWARSHTIDAMSFSHADFIDVQADNRKHFTNAGFNEYQNVIKQLEIDKLLAARSYVVVTIARSEPKVVRHASLKGAHRWLIYVPVVISAFQADTENLPTGDAKFVKHVDLSMQLVRVPFEASEEELMIESVKIKKVGK